MNLVNVQLWMIIVVTELYPFISLLMTLIILQGHGAIKELKLKVGILMSSYPIKLKFLRLLNTVPLLLYQHSKPMFFQHSTNLCVMHALVCDKQITIIYLIQCVCSPCLL